jgi:hypothetical protein
MVAVSKRATFQYCGVMRIRAAQIQLIANAGFVSTPVIENSEPNFRKGWDCGKCVAG